ncbi:MAG: TIGR03013 family PEP-CTERM/XrtA system glycosyltransferase [Nitrospirota bacterium]|nr:TIGR03013 family PEP-CTERM/XrtA system glycosyltransferase [Nitrospirota bacterium]
MRSLWRLFSKFFPNRWIKKRVLIVGDGPLAKDLARVLVFDRSYRYDVKGFLSNKPTLVGTSLVNPKVIGTTNQLFELSEKHQIEMVVVCIEDRRGALPLDSLLDVKSMGLEVVDGHRLYEAECGRLSLDELKPSFLIFSSGFRRKPLIMFLKRLGDFFGALLGLVALAPALGLIALLIKLDSPGPVLYRQLRVGHHGYPWVVLKFRSMRNDAEAEGIQWATVGDARVTRIGGWLRRLRLDELPQLFNVLKGEMSLVGPRPERPHFVQELRTCIPYYDLRHTVRPGLTGWAQICFHYAGSLEDSSVKLQYDLYYVKNLSLWLDLRILCRTIRVVLRGEGAR